MTRGSVKHVQLQEGFVFNYLWVPKMKLAPLQEAMGVLMLDASRLLEERDVYIHVTCQTLVGNSGWESESALRSGRMASSPPTLTGN